MRRPSNAAGISPRAAMTSPGRWSCPGFVDTYPVGRRRYPRCRNRDRRMVAAAPRRRPRQQRPLPRRSLPGSARDGRTEAVHQRRARGLRRARDVGDQAEPQPAGSCASVAAPRDPDGGRGRGNGNESGVLGRPGSTGLRLKRRRGAQARPGGRFRNRSPARPGTAARENDGAAVEDFPGPPAGRRAPGRRGAAERGAACRTRGGGAAGRGHPRRRRRNAAKRSTARPGRRPAAAPDALHHQLPDRRHCRVRVTEFVSKLTPQRI